MDDHARLVAAPGVTGGEGHGVIALGGVGVGGIRVSAGRAVAEVPQERQRLVASALVGENHVLADQRVDGFGSESSRGRGQTEPDQRRVVVRGLAQGVILDGGHWEVGVDVEGQHTLQFRPQVGADEHVVQHL